MAVTHGCYMLALTLWRELLDYLNALRARGMVVILIAHSKVERFEDPESSPYDRYSPRLHKHAGVSSTNGAMRFYSQLARCELKAKTLASIANERSLMRSARMEANAIMRAYGSPSCVAKNRYGIAEEMPLSWNAFVDAVAKANP